jgi:transcription elongation factor GreA
LKSESEIVAVGSEVAFEDTRLSGEQAFRIVDARGADPTNGTISCEAPVARALMGHQAGDEVSLQTPSGPRTLTVLRVSPRP